MNNKSTEKTPSEAKAIHIEQDADITALMSAVKESKSAQVKLISPNGAQALTSPINLKLLKKAANSKHKELVIVTKDRPVMVLAGGLNIKTAPDVSTEPAVPNMDELQPTLDESDEPTDPADIESSSEDKSGAGAADFNLKSEDTLKMKADGTKASMATKASKAKRIPTIDGMRKRLFAGVLLLILLLIGWFYLTRIHPTATITITAQTERVPVDLKVDISDTFVDSDPSRLQVKAFKAAQTVTKEQPFEATGEKRGGTPATGTIQISNCSESSPIALSSNTRFTSGGKEYLSTIAASIPGASFSGGSCSAPGEVTVNVESVSGGDQYNVEQGTSFTIEGVSDGIEAKASADFSGGTTTITKIISQDDIDRAASAIASETDTAIRTELANKFDETYIVLEKSYKAEASEITSEPAVASEAESGIARIDITYTLLAVRKADVEDLLRVTAEKEAAEAQGVTDNGIDSLSLTIDSQDEPATATATITTDAFLGPKLNIDNLKTEVAGTRFGDAQEMIESIEGVNSVVIDLSTFAFGTMPDTDKIDIKLEVIDSPSQNN